MNTLYMGSRQHQRYAYQYIAAELVHLLATHGVTSCAGQQVVHAQTCPSSSLKADYTSSWTQIFVIARRKVFCVVCTSYLSVYPTRVAYLAAAASVQTEAQMPSTMQEALRQRQHPQHSIVQGQSTCPTKEAPLQGDENAPSSAYSVRATGTTKNQHAIASGAPSGKHHNYKKPTTASAVFQQTRSRRPLHQLSSNQPAPAPAASFECLKPHQDKPHLCPKGLRQLPTQSVTMLQVQGNRSAPHPNQTQACDTARDASQEAHTTMCMDTKGLCSHLGALTQQVPSTAKLQSPWQVEARHSSPSPATEASQMSLPAQQKPASLSGASSSPCAPALSLNTHSSKADTCASDSATGAKAARQAALLQHIHSQHPVTRIMHNQQAAARAATSRAQQGPEEFEDITAMLSAGAGLGRVVPTATAGSTAPAPSAGSGSPAVQHLHAALQRTWQLMQQRKHSCSLPAGSSILDTVQQAPLSHQPINGFSSTNAGQQVTAASAQSALHGAPDPSKKQHKAIHAAALALAAGALKHPKSADAVAGMNPPWYEDTIPAAAQGGSRPIAKMPQSAAVPMMRQDADALASVPAPKQTSAELKLTAAVMPRFLQQHVTQAHNPASYNCQQAEVSAADSIRSGGLNSSKGSCISGSTLCEHSGNPGCAVPKSITHVAAAGYPADAGSRATNSMRAADHLVMPANGTAAAATAKQQGVYLARLFQQQQLHGINSSHHMLLDSVRPSAIVRVHNSFKQGFNEGSNASSSAPSRHVNTVDSPPPTPAADGSFTDHSSDSFYSLEDTAESQLSYALAAHLLKRTPYVGLGDRSYEVKDFDYIEHAQRRLHAEPSARDVLFVRDYRCISERMKAGARRKLVWGDM